MAKGAGYESYDALRTASHMDVLATLLFNIYISDLPTTVSREHAHDVDDQAITHADGDWQAVDGVLSKETATIGEHLQTWKLKLSTTKTMLSAFHLYNKEAKRELKVNYNNEILSAPSPNTSE